MHERGHRSLGKERLEGGFEGGSRENDAPISPGDDEIVMESTDDAWKEGSEEDDTDSDSENGEEEGRGQEEELLEQAGPDDHELSRIERGAQAWFGESVPREWLETLVSELRQEASKVYRAEQAIEWSKDEQGQPFRFPPNVCDKDLRDLTKLNNDIVQLVKVRQETLAEGRFSVGRVMSVVPADDESRPMLLKAARGMEIEVSSEFEPTLVPRQLRSSYLQVAPAVNKMIMASHNEGLVILLPTHVMMELECKENKKTFLDQSWTKASKEEGRAIVDPSKGRGMTSNQAVNSEEGKAVMKERYGKIKHPTLETLVNQVLESVDEHGWEGCTMWLADLQGAFGQLYVKPEDATLLITALTDAICAIHINGTFGYTGTPFAFNPITRAIVNALRRKLSGKASMYTDDIFGSCGIHQVESEKIICYKIVKDLLGEGGIVEGGPRDKYRSGREIVCIGWHFDLNKRVVGIARKNFVKVFNEFYQLDVEAPVSKRQVERLAGMASRYALVARQMRPFVHHLHRLKTRFRGAGRGTLVQWSLEATLDVFMWRAFLVLMALKPEKFWRKLESFRTRSWEVLLQYDSSLQGLGPVLSTKGVDGTLIPVRVASIITTYQLNGDSRYQNAMEFSSVVVAFLMMAELGMTSVPLKIVGDSIASETWCKKERFRSVVSRGAAAAFVALGVEFDFWIEETEFIAGKDNIMCDELSRRSEKHPGKSAQQLALEWGFEERLVWTESGSDVRTELLAICDPTLVMETEEQFISVGTRITAIIDHLKAARLNLS